MELAKIILAIWGAVLSTILAVMKIYQDQKESRPKLFIDCKEMIAKGESVIMIQISNIWKRPVTIVEFSLGVGVDENNQKHLYTYAFKPGQKLQDSDPFEMEIEKDNITKPAVKLAVDDFLFARLWINIRLSFSSQTIKKEVYINPKFYDISVNPNYDDFLATAAFFNQNVMPEYSRMWARKMKYEKR